MEISKNYLERSLPERDTFHYFYHCCLKRVNNWMESSKQNYLKLAWLQIDTSPTHGSYRIASFFLHFVLLLAIRHWYRAVTHKNKNKRRNLRFPLRIRLIWKKMVLFCLMLYFYFTSNFDFFFLELSFSIVWLWMYLYFSCLQSNTWKPLEELTVFCWQSWVSQK